MADIEILLAAYKPNQEYFHQLLRSLNQQTYKNILLSVIDDSENEETFNEIKTILEEEIRAFPFRISKNTKNIGSNRTFERLTQNSTCKYLAYCDQDDIWEDCKLQTLVDTLENTQATLCYSDLSVIDENGARIAASFKKYNKRIRHLAGEKLFPDFLRRNSITGCTLLMRADVAKKAVPFCHEYYVHDHWLTLIASANGRISYIREPLVRYRIHGNNQIGKKILSGVVDKHNYIAAKLQIENEKFNHLLESGLFRGTLAEAIKQELIFVNTRIRFFEKHSFRNTAAMIFSLRHDPQLILFELFLALAPNVVGRRIIKLFR